MTSMEAREESTPAQSSSSRPDLDEQVQIIETFHLSLENSRPLSKICSSISFKELTSRAGFGHQPEGKRLQGEHDSETGCPLCSILWNALMKDLDNTYSSTTFKSKHYCFLDSPEDNVPYDDFKTQKERLAALERDPIRLFFNPLQDTPSYQSTRPSLHSSYTPEKVPKAYEFREFTLWSASLKMLNELVWRNVVYIGEATYQELRLVGGLSSLRTPLSQFFDDIVMPDKIFISSRFHVETTWEDPLSEMVVYKSIQSDMRSDQSIKMVQGWLRSCITSHKGCPDISTDYLPTRLIDVGPLDGTIQPRLFLPSYSKYAVSNRSLNYIALSYCWGRQDELSENPPIKTTSCTLGDHMKSIPMESLPKTIADAVILTRLLGFRYLWVDSLCILQGDDKDEAARKDWPQESSTMSSVYGKAVLTICAAWGRSVHNGLFTSRNSTESDGIRLKLNCGEVPTLSGAVRLRKPPGMQPFKNSLDQPLYHRAWTLQEHLLSPRVLICNEDQFAWECQTHNLTESGYKMKSIGALRLDADFLQKAKGNKDVFQDMWQCIATDYSARSLTKPSDKLAALAGIARKFHELNGCDYLAGIWRESLLDDLLWAHYSTYWMTNGSEYDPEFKSLRSKPSRYRAPSWSWTAVDGPVRWPLADSEGEYLTRLLDWKVSHRNQDIFGEVADGYLTLQGPLWKIPSNIAVFLLHPEHHDPNFSWDSTAQWMYETYMVLESVESVSKVQVLDSGGLRDLFLLRIKTDGALILKLDGRKREVEGQESYKRVGVLAGWSNRSHWDTSLCVETICRIV